MEKSKNQVGNTNIIQQQQQTTASQSQVESKKKKDKPGPLKLLYAQGPGKARPQESILPSRINQ